MEKVTLVKNAMLAVQRFPWEQGVCMQAVYEMGDMTTAIAMAHDAVLRQKEDGRLAIITENIAVTDPAANGEVVYRAYEMTRDKMFSVGAEKMLQYLMKKAPKTKTGILCHNQVSFHEGFTKDQVWADSIYMAPPFLAVMGEIEEAIFQIKGMMGYLLDEKTGVLKHIYDAGSGKFVRDKLWATGSGWALLGMGRVLDCCYQCNFDIVKTREVREMAVNLLNALLLYQQEDGRFHDILDDSSSFMDGTCAMMMASFIYRGIVGDWLEKRYRRYADKVFCTMENYVDEYGLIHGVCGCPDFVKEGTSAESMAAYLMMHAWAEKV